MLLTRELGRAGPPGLGPAALESACASRVMSWSRARRFPALGRRARGAGDTSGPGSCPAPGTALPDPAWAPGSDPVAGRRGGKLPEVVTSLLAFAVEGRDAGNGFGDSWGVGCWDTGKEFPAGKVVRPSVDVPEKDVAAAGSLEASQDWLEEPGTVEGVPAHGTG